MYPDCFLVIRVYSMATKAAICVILSKPCNCASTQFRRYHDENRFSVAPTFLRDVTTLQRSSPALDEPAFPQLNRYLFPVLQTRTVDAFTLRNYSNSWDQPAFPQSTLEGFSTPICRTVTASLNASTHLKP